MYRYSGWIWSGDRSKNAHAHGSAQWGEAQPDPVGPEPHLLASSKRTEGEKGSCSSPAPVGIMA